MDLVTFKKCGGVIGKPVYLKYEDALQYTCTVCGFNYCTAPKDQQRDTTLADLTKLANRRREGR